MMANKYEVGEVVLFQRETGLRWEPGEYMGADASPPANGKWHRIRDNTAFFEVHYVPNRRIQKAPELSRKGGVV